MSQNSDKHANLKTDNDTVHSEEDEALHSANDWEHVDLGDTDRRQKFLRLMGASKKQHSGRFVIGEPSSDHHGTAAVESQHVEHGLEHQFQEGLEHKLSGAARRHCGLGFHRDSQDDEQTDKDDKKEPARDRSRSPINREPSPPHDKDHSLEKPHDEKDRTPDEEKDRSQPVTEEAPQSDTKSPAAKSPSKPNFLSFVKASDS